MRCDCIVPNLFVGPDLRYKENFAALRSLEITAILSLQTENDFREGGIEQERNAASRAGMEFCSVPVTDFDRLDLQRKLPQCVAALDELLKTGHRVYLHCTAGVNRSPTVAAAYIHWCQGWPLEEALACVEHARNCVPDAGAIHRAEWPPNQIERES
ncbi:MAG: dual specificity protein phosphatase family protein [Acidobacteriia bacterium]|nr:dual specificity protein phosphatase family protein [Terriglobia bacterium]